MLRRTPCIGICSTTYGDLVCRGCKRFAHEIVGWNGYQRDQRSAVWARLLTLRAGATRQFIDILVPERLGAGDVPMGFGEPFDSDPHLAAYEALRQRVGEQVAVAEVQAHLGIRVIGGAGSATVEDLLLRIDQEFYHRSLAQYERSFRIPAL
jgi:predicted Fe-S protein YdhL (DUF1289 family)